MTVQDRIRLESKDLLPYLGENHMLMVLREDRTRGKVKEVMGKILMWIPYDADYEQRRILLENGTADRQSSSLVKRQPFMQNAWE